jgi:hypothetical protein
LIYYCSVQILPARCHLQVEKNRPSIEEMVNVAAAWKLPWQGASFSLAVDASALVGEGCISAPLGSQSSERYLRGAVTTTSAAASIEERKFLEEAGEI